MNVNRIRNSSGRAMNRITGETHQPWSLTNDGKVLRHYLYYNPGLLSYGRRNLGYENRLGHSFGSLGTVVALGFEGPVFVVTVREK